MQQGCSAINLDLAIADRFEFVQQEGDLRVPTELLRMTSFFQRQLSERACDLSEKALKECP